MSRHELVVVVTAPPDCDFSGVWEVIEEAPLAGGDHQLRLRQGNSYIGAKRSNVRAATGSLGPSNDDSPAVQVEMHAAEMLNIDNVLDVWECDGALMYGITSDEDLAWDTSRPLAEQFADTAADDDAAADAIEPAASDLNLHWPAVRTARIDRAHAVLASLLLRDEQMSPDHVRDFDDSEAVVFSLMVPNFPRGIALSSEVGPALLRAGFAAVSYGQPNPTPGTDGYMCEFSVTVGAP